MLHGWVLQQLQCDILIKVTHCEIVDNGGIYLNNSEEQKFQSEDGQQTVRAQKNDALGIQGIMLQI